MDFRLKGRTVENGEWMVCGRFEEVGVLNLADGHQGLVMKERSTGS
jgi:hypothetical protein